MSTGLKITLIVILFLIVVGFIGLTLFTRSLAVDMIQNPMSERNEEGDAEDAEEEEEYEKD